MTALGRRDAAQHRSLRQVLAGAAVAIAVLTAASVAQASGVSLHLHQLVALSDAIVVARIAAAEARDAEAVIRAVRAGRTGGSHNALFR